MINDPVLEDFVKTPKTTTANLKDMWERSLIKASGGAV
jgi:hypothetical protein